MSPAAETLGTWLARERAGRDVGLEEIATSTRVPQATLRAIEADAHDRLPAPVFVKGFLRSYALYLGLDPKRVLARYAETLAEMTRTAERTIAEEEAATARQRMRRAAALVFVAAVVAALVFATLAGR